MRSAGRTDAHKTNGPAGQWGSQVPPTDPITPGPPGNWGGSGNQPPPGIGPTPLPMGAGPGMEPPGTEPPPFQEPDPLPGTGPGPNPTPNPVYDPGAPPLYTDPGGPAVQINPTQEPPYYPPVTEHDGSPEPWYGRLARFMPYIGPVASLGHIAGNAYRQWLATHPHAQRGVPNQPQGGRTSTQLGNYQGPTPENVNWYSRFYRPPEGIQNAINRGDYPDAYGHTQDFLAHGLSVSDQAFLAGPVKFGNRFLAPPPTPER